MAAKRGAAAVVALLVVAAARENRRGNCSDAKFVLILGTGRSGSTSALRMVNSLPGVALSGEHFGQVRDVMAFHRKSERARRAKGPAWVDGRFAKSTKCWLQSWYRHDGTAGFKEIRYNDDETLEFLRWGFGPSVTFVLNYRESLSDQLRSRRRAHGFPKASTGGDEQLRAETKALLEFYERHREQAFLLPLERFSLRTFDDLFAFLGFPQCRALRLPHLNKNGGYGGKVADLHGNGLVRCLER